MIARPDPLLFDAAGNLTRVIDSEGNAIITEYNRRGEKIAMNDPDMGHWTYRYNVLGELISQISQTGARQQVVNMTYDVLGRITSKDVVGSSANDTTWTYDDQANGIGLPGTVSIADYAQTYHYDNLSRPVTTDTRIGLDNFSQTQHYDNLGRVYQIDYPKNGLSIIRHYNQYGYLHQVTDAANDTVYWQGNETNADGAFIRSTLGNGRVVQKAYDSQSGRLYNITTDNNVQNLHYEFDAIGNIKQRQDIFRNSTETFRYDALNRVTESLLTINGIETQRQNTYYDALGNITEKEGRIYRYDSTRPHAVTQVGNQTLNYDANGNLSFDSSGRNFTWTYDNKPDRITQGNIQRLFDYGPDRARYRQRHITNSDPQSTTLYVGGLFEQIKEGANTRYRHYIKVGDQTIATVIQYEGAGTQTRYLHRDHLGSVASITDELGNVLEQNDYDAFGQRRPITGNINDPFPVSIEPRGYTGHEHLDDLGIIHMNGRIYDPSIGRFLSADTFIQFPNNQQSLNRYSYVLNNPLSYTDPSGHLVFGVIGAFLGKALGGYLAGTAFGTAVGSTIATAVGYSVALGVTTGLASMAQGGSFAEGFKTGAISGALFSVAVGIADSIGMTAISGLEGVTVQRVIVTGIAGGASSEISGSSFGSGFAGAAFSSALGGKIKSLAGGSPAAGTIMSAVVGGTASALAGGSFANGALSGAFQYVVARGNSGVIRSASSNNSGGNSLNVDPHKLMAELRTYPEIQAIELKVGKFTLNEGYGPKGGSGYSSQGNTIYWGNGDVVGTLYYTTLPGYIDDYANSLPDYGDSFINSYPSTGSMSARRFLVHEMYHAIDGVSDMEYLFSKAKAEGFAIRNANKFMWNNFRKPARDPRRH